MPTQTEDILLQQCLQQVEVQLGWGSSEHWTTQDFESLRIKIREATDTNLSVTTLKRLWGKVNYDSQPTVATLNALVQFLGYENWRCFQQQYKERTANEHVQPEKSSSAIVRKKKRISWTGIALLMIGLIALSGFYFFSKEPVTPVELNNSTFSFTSKMMVSEGVPNSIIFDYDASAAHPEDTIYIQQSWDKRLRKQVSRTESVHKSIYYYPGFFLAKLVVNNEIVQEQPLYIKTSGWLPLVEQEDVPVYFKTEDALQTDGHLQLPISRLKENNITLQPETPWVSYFNSQEFGVKSDNVIFETTLKNEYREGAAICQHTEIHVLLEGGALVIPLAIKGCVSELAFYDASGKKEDTSPLGCDFSDWVTVTYKGYPKRGELYINGQLAYDMNMDFPSTNIIGLRYRFQGTGSIHLVKFSNLSGEVVYEEDFANRQVQ